MRHLQKSKIKIIGLVDSNSNPEGIDYLIPANDDATKAIELMCAAMSEAISDGKKTMVSTAPAPITAAVEAQK